jgi:uncharacterized protein YigA (DUF484 family)
MSFQPELLALIGSFVASAFAIVRFSLAQSKAMSERFVSYLESSLQRQEAINMRFQSSLEELTRNVRENSLLLHRIAERMPGGPHES